MELDILDHHITEPIYRKSTITSTNHSSARETKLIEVESGVFYRQDSSDVILTIADNNSIPISEWFGYSIAMIDNDPINRRILTAQFGWNAEGNFSIIAPFIATHEINTADLPVAGNKSTKHDFSIGTAGHGYNVIPIATTRGIFGTGKFLIDTRPSASTKTVLVRMGFLARAAASTKCFALCSMQMNLHKARKVGRRPEHI